MREEYQSELTLGIDNIQAVIADHRQFLESLLAQTEGTNHFLCEEDAPNEGERKEEIAITNSTSTTNADRSTPHEENKVASPSLILPEKDEQVTSNTENKENPNNIELTNFS